ncbi:hypothetical protein JJC03_09165 [Flavobacterium oreochromis]|uniref:hypothetical protein n=1 Tax=Flavobacterium oreochromis TaxID=2906078 RepID=UPI001CE6FAC1|nr:hypothetical protein [Flavobacterium oreochromis]QYS85408.1 hypothetical protein JJC03_09165 [Flavobacterium oreochromis]
MHYSSLDYLPVKVYYDILETNNVNLLSDTITDKKELSELWTSLSNKFKDLDNSDYAKQTFSRNKQIQVLEVKQRLVLMYLNLLSFEYDDAIVSKLNALGYNVRTDNTDDYYLDLKRVEVETNGIEVKINALKNQASKTDNSQSVTIDEVLASYSVILGFDYDYNTISCTKYLALKSQVNKKIKALETKNTAK